jgi:archaellum component FlaC
MSWIFRFGYEGSRETLLVTKWHVFQLRKGNKTFSIKNAERWSSFSEWAIENSEKFLDSLPFELSKDSRLALSILLKYNTMTSLDDNTYRKIRNSSLYLKNGSTLTPLYVANDGTMKFRGKLGKTFSDLDVKPEFWIKLKSGDFVEYYENRTNGNFVEQVSAKLDLEERPRIEVPLTDVTESLNTIAEPISDVKEPLPDVSNTISDVKEPMPDVSNTISEVKEPLPDVSNTISDVKEPIADTMSNEKESISNQKATVSDVKAIVSNVKDSDVSVPDSHLKKGSSCVCVCM